MSNRHLLVAAALVAELSVALCGAGLARPARAQASAPAAALPAASAPLRIRPQPRLLTPAEKRDNAAGAATGELRTERPVKPQLSIPFGRTPPPPTAGQQDAVRRGGAASASGVDDAAARCDAEIGEQARAACRHRNAVDGKPL